MEVFEAVRTVLAVRRYADREVPADARRRVLEAGRSSGSSMNLQPWHFVLVEERATLARLGTIMQSGSYIADASFAIVVLVEADSPYAVSDASRAIQNMILTGWADGISSNWVGFGPMPTVEALLGVPNTFKGLAVVPFGYSATKLGRGKKDRKPLAQIASREHFGTPFA